jgi:hypothetical protein
MLCAQSVSSRSVSSVHSDMDSSFDSLLHIMEGAGINIHAGSHGSSSSVGSVDHELLKQVLMAELSKPLTKMEMVSLCGVVV